MGATTVVLTLVVSLAAACAGVARWTKPGATQDEFAATKWQCLRDAKAMNDDTSWAKGIAETRIFNRCMADHGWQPQEG